MPVSRFLIPLVSTVWMDDTFLLDFEILPLRRRVGGFAIAPDTPSQRTPMLLDFYWKFFS